MSEPLQEALRLGEKLGYFVEMVTAVHDGVEYQVPRVFWDDFVAAQKELDAIHFAAHMPDEYQHGLPSWVNQHLYAIYIGAKISPHIQAQIENGTLSFPDAPIWKELARLRDIIREYYTQPNFPTNQFIRAALGDDEARKLGVGIDGVEETNIAIENGWVEP